MGFRKQGSAELRRMRMHGEVYTSSWYYGPVEIWIVGVWYLLLSISG